MKNFSSQTSFLIVLVLILCISMNSAQPVKLPDQGDNSNNGHGGGTDFQKICERICKAGHPCPPECADLIDPWAMDTYPLDLNKRSPGIDGFTFDDYLFLRWLGRDMNRHRLQ